MALFGSLSTVQAQTRATPAFALAYAYVARCLAPGSAEAARIAAVPEGETRRVELGEGVFALEQAYQAKAVPEGRWEGHERHIDVQVVIAGVERMGVREAAGLRREEDFLAERDLAFFAAGGLEAAEAVLTVGAGGVAVFYPADAHMPSVLAAGAQAGASLVRKTVVKVPVSGA
jgi:biofilm protein TabA